MSNKLTGNTRYRIHKPFVGKALMVLQVEETMEVDVYAGGYVHTSRYKRWRDAELQDIKAEVAT